ncbi:MAG: TIGR01777 family protein [Desulfobacteraceae bacterium]|uniref:TIGR01777 family protein n=1 Tax=Candidatus Desulfacyla euxinica TaxID=2841693 RepID=A0A8J6N0I2_9DELT|nr:TIGR01777 family protein [Candidatus Desulfacyla euxinica]MBL6977706.1 TIGR01777 family protein [Desulfobacteraceae bacterium]
MKAFMTGGTGFVGTVLTKSLTQKGYKVTLLTRKIRGERSVPRGAILLEGDPAKAGPWQGNVADHDVIINLAGASIFTRWTKREKRMIRETRILTTKNLVNALSDRRVDEITFISTSAVGYYGFHGDEELDETCGTGSDFLASVAREWEAAALEVERPGVRVLLCRLGIVLGRNGGALGEIIPLFQKGLGSRLGDGQQWLSWIHEDDLARLYLFLMERRELSGPFNCTAPGAVRNKDLTKVMGEVLGQPLLMPAVPGFMVRLIKGEFGTVLLKGQKVLPKRLLEAGFRFHFPDLRGALKDIIG